MLQKIQYHKHLYGAEDKKFIKFYIKINELWLVGAGIEPAPLMFGPFSMTIKDHQKPRQF